jgi:uncharacterized protein
MLATRMVVIQPTTYCNIDCDYCYLKLRAQHQIISRGTIEAIADRIVNAIGRDIQTLVVWHGGEPTTVPIDWYRMAYPILQNRKQGAPLAFAVQTNGIGVDDRWAAFFSETGTRVGLSLDGPQFLHDRHRRTRRGRGTWDLVMRALDTLRRHGVEPGIITVLTADALNHADEMLAFFVDHGLSDVSFSVEEQEGANTTSSLDFPGVEDAVQNFLFSFLHRVIHENLPIHVREAERILGLLASGISADGTNEQTDPLAAITVDWNGGVYTYSPEFTEHAAGEWEFFRIGNVQEDTLEEILAREPFRRLVAEVSVGLAECAKSCAFWTICGGGSPVNRVAEHGSLAVAETQFCRLTIQATARALQKLLPG